MAFVAFVAGGHMILSDAAATGDNTSGNLTLWTFPGGKLVRQYRFRPDVISDDGRYAADSHSIFSLDTGTKIISTSAGELNYSVYAFAPDNRNVAVSGTPKGAPGHAIRIMALPDGKIVASFGSALPDSIAFSPDGRLLATGYWDIVVLWDARTGKRVATLRGFGRYVDSLSFDARGRRLAGGTDWGTVQVWDVRRRRRIGKFAVDGGYVSTPAFYPRGRYLAFGTYGTGTVWLADLKSGGIVDSRKISDIGCGSVDFSPDGRFLIAPSTGGLVTWPYDVGGTVRVFRVRLH